MWHGLMTILDLEIKTDKETIKYHNIKNMLHSEGEEFMLKAVFLGDLPTAFYFGLDNRTSVLASDTMSSLIDEPTLNGYSRAVIGPTNFTIEVVSNVHRAVGQTVSFTASGGSWGPVKNFFMTNQGDNSGYLICSATLPTPIIVTDSNIVNMRMSMSLRECP